MLCSQMGPSNTVAREAMDIKEIRVTKKEASDLHLVNRKGVLTAFQKLVRPPPITASKV